MNSNLKLKLLRIASDLDKTGHFEESDRLFVKISQYYPQQSLTKVPMVQYVEYDELEDEFINNEENYRKKKPNLVVKQYFDLTSEDDQEDGMNLEALLNGPDSVPGPAYIDPGNLASSPSMAGDSTSFTFEENYQKNVDEGNAWKNRIPLR
jgi:hypothetical protein